MKRFLLLIQITLGIYTAVWAQDTIPPSLRDSITSPVFKIPTEQTTTLKMSETSGISRSQAINRRRRNTAIALSSAGFALHAVGIGLLVDATAKPYDNQIEKLAGGTIMIMGGTGLSIGSMVLWIKYAVKRDRYKNQNGNF
jgi:hypothetical protein